MSNSATAIVLAAGLGTRMQSQKPKVLHGAAGRTLISHVLTQLNGAGVSQIRVVLGFGGEAVKQHLWGMPGVEFYTQSQQLGTADAVKSAKIESLTGPVLICNGDHPLITANDYQEALSLFAASKCDLLVIGAQVKDPTGFGRLSLDRNGALQAIVEEKDATAAEKKIRLVNAGLYVVNHKCLQKYLPLIKNNNAKKEFYLTDLVSLVIEDGGQVSFLQLAPRVCRGVNNQEELALAARSLYLRKCRELMAAGVVMIDPRSTYIDSDVIIRPETVVGPGCMISGHTTIGVGCVIEGFSQIRNSKIGNRVEVRWGSLIDQSEIHDSAVVGPYARLRPESTVGVEAHVGNFVELKKTTLGARAKANHLTYLGDAEIGEGTNIGCGTITCNYAVDRKKYKTKIGKNAFIGSDTQFVAPVTVGDGAVIASGSTITQDVPSNALGVARSRQRNIPDYNKE